MSFKGFIKYRLPNTIEVVKMTGFWQEVNQLRGFADSDFVISNFDNSKVYIFKEDKKVGAVDLSLCYRLRDAESYTNYGEYLRKVEGVLNQINSNHFQKIIFSRRVKVSKKIDALSVFKTINAHYDNSFNYLLGIESIGVWMGASPEVLMKTEKEGILMHSLAGTCKRNEESTYKWSEKELQEQKYVTDYLIEKIKEAGITDIKLNGPFDFEHGQVAHLKTELKVKTSDNEINQLLRILPPTPAVCGIPKKAILNEIKEIEGYDRLFYTGFLGIYKKDAINLFVNLRCMELFIDSASVYVGGGITAQSDAESEWDETELKAKTLLDNI